MTMHHGKQRNPHRRVREVEDEPCHVALHALRRLRELRLKLAGGERPGLGADGREGQAAEEAEGEARPAGTERGPRDAWDTWASGEGNEGRGTQRWGCSCRVVCA